MNQAKSKSETKPKPKTNPKTKTEPELKTYQKIGIGFLIFVIAGIIGWLYEFFLAWFETGQIYMKGGNFLPWINIYAFGALLIAGATWKVKKHPWAVFLLSVLITGSLELLAGWLVYTIGDGTRYWNYDHGIWQIGSVNGFICLASITAFGLSALLLMYVVLPLCIRIATRMNKRAFLIFTTSLFVLVLADEVINLTLKNLNQWGAMDFYQSLGLEYQSF
ncbi:putative ABC transporter permease [Candidatus Saccharibacteria bacterium]|nr:putative ABC transporter permease [Candidatus Saccharibacteria bacterium]